MQFYTFPLILTEKQETKYLKKPQIHNIAQNDSAPCIPGVYLKSGTWAQQC